MPFLTCSVCGQLFHIRPSDPETWTESDYPEPLCLVCWKAARASGKAAPSDLPDSD